MRKKLSRSKIICLAVVVLCCTQCQSVRLPYNDGGTNHAIVNAIHDFKITHKSLFKKDMVFYIITRDNINYYDLSIIGIDQKQYLYNHKTAPNDNLFPNNYYLLDSKLFIWYDDKKIIDEHTINTYLKYNLLVDNKNDSVLFLDNLNMDDSKIGVSYLFCKNNLATYKKYKTNIKRMPSFDLICN